jgi:2-methylcitrate dehydratase PrpD
MIAGADDPAPQLLRKALRPGHGDAGLYFSGETVPAPEAAWINGTAGRALDYDDVALRGHPSTMLVPAILAEGEALRASRRDMLAAYVAGYETCAELVWCEPGHHHRKGWHPTGIFGPIGAAAACASLRHLDAEHASNALALAASQSSGVMANFGTMTTPFHAGRSAHSGLITARLAEVGFTHWVRVLLSDTHSLIVRNHWPQTGLEGKFNMEFAMAAAVIAARRIYRRLCSAPGCPGFDVPGRHRNKPELRSGGLRSHGIGPGTGRPRSPAATSKARKCGG